MKLSLHSLLRTLALAGALGTSANLGHATIAVSNITAAANWWWSVESLSSYESFTVGNEAATLQGLNFQMSWIAGSTTHVDRRIMRLHAPHCRPERRLSPAGCGAHPAASPGSRA